MGLRRGDIVVLAPRREFGKPRPAVVIQADASLTGATVTFLPLTSDVGRFPLARVAIDPTPQNGLQVSSDVMVDLIQTVGVDRVGRVIGRVEPGILQLVETALMVHLGLA